MRLMSVALVVILFTAALADAADWPQWRGPNRDGVSTETGLLKEWPKDGPKLAWKIKVNGSGYSSPTIIGDKLFITAANDDVDGKNEFVLCLNVKDGSQRWKTELPDNEKSYMNGWGSGPRSTPTVDVFELPEKSEYPRRAGMIWTHPVVTNGKLYLRDHELLFCYDIAAK
jgi:outer membrane protein assembly factor BamB